jgi:hypothetical protein
MTTFFRRSLKCANCGRSSEHEMLGSTNAFGSPDLDLRPPEMHRSTMGAWLQECPHCRYVAPNLSRPVGDLSVIVGSEYCGLLADQRFDELARRFLAYALLISASDLEGAGQSRLRAAWVCDDYGRPDLATDCRTSAAECFKRLKPFEDSEPGVTQGAILVDVLRRTAQFDEAESECSELLRLGMTQGVVRQVLEYQLGLIAQRDSFAHTIAEAHQERQGGAVAKPDDL